MGIRKAMVTLQWEDTGERVVLPFRIAVSEEEIGEYEVMHGPDVQRGATESFLKVAAEEIVSRKSVSDAIPFFFPGSVKGENYE